MLNLEDSRIDLSVPAKVANADNIPDEGMALVINAADGDGINVKPGTDASGERFYGVAMFERRPPSSMPHVHEFEMPAVAPADGAVVATLPFTPTAGSILVFDDDTALGNEDTGAAAGLVIVGREVRYETTDATVRWQAAGGGAVAVGSKIRVQYAYAPTVEQQVALVGTHQNLTVLGAGAQATCVRRGIVYTTYFDASSEYEIGGAVGLATGGRFDNAAGATVDIANSAVIHIPSPLNPYLGIELF
jgi:hypothetical protein